MGYSQGILTEPLSIDEISTALGYASYDLYKLALCDKVNKFSKKKPYRGAFPERPASYTATTGSDGAPAGMNPRWGLLVPTNTAQQLSASSASRFLKPLAWRASGRGGNAGNVHNYTYLRLRAGTDYARMDDFVGYVSTAPVPWSAGVAGSTANDAVSGNSNGTHLSVDTFDTAEISFYMGRPTNASLSFKDLFILDDYYFIAELYKDDQGITSDTDVPEAVIVGVSKVSAMDYGISLAVKVSRIKQLLGFSGDGEHRLVAVVGISRITSINPASYEDKSEGRGLGYAVLNTDTLRNNLVAGNGSLPPWTSLQKSFICDITLHSYSKIAFQVTQYASPTSTSYAALPTTAISYAADGLRLKATVRNVGTTSFTFNDSSGRNRVQIQPRGNYDTEAPSYSSMCLSPVEGKWHELKVSNAAALGNTTAITIAGGSSNSAVYLQALAFLPIGRTSAFSIRISTDGGNTWVITGSFSGGFIVN